MESPVWSSGGGTGFKRRRTSILVTLILVVFSTILVLPPPSLSQAAASYALNPVPSTQAAITADPAETPTPAPAPTPTPEPVAQAQQQQQEDGASIASDNDSDNDNLIEVTNLAQLIAMQWDLDGDGTPESNTSDYNAAFTSGVSGCSTTCAGYELNNDITVTANPSNAGTNYLIPGVWNTTFEGNSKEIINQDRRPLFETIGAATGSTTAEVKNLTIESKHAQGAQSAVLADKVDDKGKVTKVAVIGIVKPAIVSTQGTVHFGGMVNSLDGGVIANSYARVVVEVFVNNPQTANTVTLFAGGLVGYVSSGSKVLASYATGDVTMRGSILHTSCPGIVCSGYIFDDSGVRTVGGLAGGNAGDIHAVYSMGDVIAAENLNTSAETIAGGLVGSILSGGTLRAGYAIGDVSIYPGSVGGDRNDDNDYGKAVGRSAGTITDVYGSGSNPNHASTPSGVTNKTESELETPKETDKSGSGDSMTYPTGIYANWNYDIDNADGDDTLTTQKDDPWDFGTNSELPTIKYNSPSETHSQQQPAMFTLTASPTTIYESTLDGAMRATSSTITATLSATKTYDIIITLPAPKDSAYSYATGDSRIFTIPRNTTTKTLTVNAINNQKCGAGDCGVTSNADVVQTLTPTADHNAELSGNAPTLTITDDDIMSKPTGFYITGKANDTKLYAYWDAGTAGSPDGFYLDYKSGAQNYDTSSRRVTITGGSKVTGEVTGLAAGTTYTARLIAYKSTYENSVASDEDTGSPGGIDYDSDNDWLIEVGSLEQLNAIRHDKDGVGNSNDEAWKDAFPNRAVSMGCPTSQCDGYELDTDLDFDTDGDGDIDAGDYVDLDGDGTKDDDEDAIIWNGGDGWNPIPNYTAILEGNQYEIKNLFINRSSNLSFANIGLFNTITTTGQLRNLYLTGVDVTGSNTASSGNVFVSALAVWNQGTISDSYVTGSVTASQTNASGGTAYAGGFAGNNSGTIRKSYSSANVTATATGSSDAIAGGLLAWNLGPVEASYATGNVSVTGSTNTSSEIDAGGLVGRNNGGTLRAVYATGNVSATAGYTVDVGGLVGHNMTGSTVTVAWSKGTVTSTGRPSGATLSSGGLVGDQDGTVTHAYWDTDVSGIADDTDNTAPEGKTTSDLQTPTAYGSGSSLYASWNVNVDGMSGNDNPWDFGTSSQYPVLHVRTLPHSLLQDVPTVTWAVSNATICESTAGTNTNACGANPVTSTTITPTISKAWATDISYTIPVNAAYTSNKTKLTIPAGDTTVTGATLTAVNNNVDAAHNVLNLSPPSSHLRQASSVPAITIKDDDLPKPTGLKVSTDGTNLQLNWTRVTLATSYTLQQSTSSAFTPKTDIPIASGSTVEHKITSGLTTGTTYHFRLIAKATGYEDSAPSDVVSATPNSGDYDADNDGLIEVSTLAQLNAIRYDLDGNGQVAIDDQDNYDDAFQNAEDNMGCGETAVSISSNETGNPTCHGYELSANLDFDTNNSGGPNNGDTYYNSGAGWDPIGGTFTGTFEGNSYTISNLFIDRSGSTTVQYAGLFGQLGSAAEIRNLRLEGVDVTVATNAGASTSPGAVYAGGIAGDSAGDIISSYVIGDVTAEQSNLTNATLTEGNAYVGGLVGNNTGNITASYARGDVLAEQKSTTANLSTYAGGLVGYHNTGTITASYAVADAEAKTTATAATATLTAGGLVGHLQGGSVIASYSRGIPATTGGSSPTQRKGGLAGYKNSTGVTDTDNYWDTSTSGITATGAGTGKTTSELRTPTVYGTQSTDIYKDWDVDLDTVTAGTQDGWHFGTSGHYPVLKYGLTANNQRGTVTLAISPTTICETTAGSDTTACGSDNVTTATITPTVTGRFFETTTVTLAPTCAINNVSQTTSDCATLAASSFAITTAGAVTPATITVTAVNDKTNAAHDKVVTIAGSTGNLDAPVTSANLSLTIEDDDVMAKPTGLKLSVDGTNVQADWDEVSNAGGYTLQWHNTADSWGSPIGSETKTGASSTTHTITTGLNTGTTYHFRVIATKTGFDDSEPSDVVNVTPATNKVDYDNDNNGLIGVDTLAKLNAIRWDLDGDGVADNEADRPKYELAFPNAEDNMGCNETAGSISSIGNPACKGYELTSNLDFNTNGDTRADDKYWNGGLGWDPIGGVSGSAYTGEFDGQTFTISNLYIDRTSGNYAGLFASLNGTNQTIENVSLINVDVTLTPSTGSNLNVGGLAGHVGSSTVTIKDSYTTGRVRAGESTTTRVTHTSGIVSYVGGLVGISSGKIVSAYSLADVSGYSTGTVAQVEIQAGGLVGRSSGSITASYASGDVTADTVAQNNGRAIAGGLVGRLQGTITASYARGSASAAYDATATTNVTGYAQAGGLVGRQTSNITASFSTGAATATGDGTLSAGGLVGSRTGGTTMNSYWDTTTSGITATGQGTGKTTSELQTPTAYGTQSTDIYKDWNLNLNGVTGNDDPWNFGTASQYPVLKYGGQTASQQRVTVTLTASPTTIWERALTTPSRVNQSTLTVTPGSAWDKQIVITVPTNAAEYTLGASTVTFNAGSTTAQTTTMTAVNNLVDAANNAISLAITPGSPWVTIGAAPTVTINDDDELTKPTGVKLSVDGTKIQVDWTQVTGATGYKVQWNSTSSTSWSNPGEDTVSSGSTVTYIISPTPALTPDTLYYVRVLPTKSGADEPPSDTVSTTTRASAGTGDYDADDDGLIEVSTLAQLNAIRWDLDGNGVASTGNKTTYADAFENAEDNMGCNESIATITSGPGNPPCHGYELSANLNFDTNNTPGNRMDDSYYNSGAGWDPIGGTTGSAYTGDFNGNTYTISNLFIDRTSGTHAGLFAYLNGASGTTIENVSLVNVDVTFSPTITGGNVKVYTGGLAGRVGSGVTIEGSSTTGRVRAGESATEAVSFSSPLGYSYVGGLVGKLNGAIVSGYSHADVTAYTTSTANSAFTYAGGLAGETGTSGSITASYARGAVAATCRRRMRAPCTRAAWWDTWAGTCRPPTLAATFPPITTRRTLQASPEAPTRAAWLALSLPTSPRRTPLASPMRRETARCWKAAWLALAPPAQPPTPTGTRLLQKLRPPDKARARPQTNCKAPPDTRGTTQAGT